MIERRRRRSDRPASAVRLFLAARAEALGAAGARVRSTSGRTLAAVGERFGRKPAVASWELAVAGRRVVIELLGPRMSDDLGPGVRRILG